MKKIVAAFKDSAPVHEKGLHVAGHKYFVIKADDRSLYGKQVSSDPSQKHTPPSSCSGYGDAAAEADIQTSHRVKKASSSSKPNNQSS